LNNPHQVTFAATEPNFTRLRTSIGYGPLQRDLLPTKFQRIDFDNIKTGHRHHNPFGENNDKNRDNHVKILDFDHKPFTGTTTIATSTVTTNIDSTTMSDVNPDQSEPHHDGSDKVQNNDKIKDKNDKSDKNDSKSNEKDKPIFHPPSDQYNSTLYTDQFTAFPHATSITDTVLDLPGQSNLSSFANYGPGNTLVGLESRGSGSLFGS